MIATLRDGARVEIRPIRPEDRDELAAGLERLSPESRYRRFLTPTDELSGRELDYLTRVDHSDHEALVARDADSGDGIGVARFVRWADDPEAAEFAAAVADDWQGRGVGTLLLDELTARAREEGVRRFTALVLSDNRAALDLAARLGPVRIREHAAGAVELEVELPPRGLGPAIKEALRSAARGELSLWGRR